MKRTPRYVALSVLVSWNRLQEPIDQLLNKELTKCDLADSRDTHLISALLHGVMRWQGYLDFIISRFSKHPLKKMKPVTRAALRIGVYQLLYMDRIPQAIAIHETVQALREQRQPKWITGFVNGVLRSVKREQESLPAPVSDEVACLNLPGWLRLRWEKRYGQERCLALCRAINTQPATTIRLTGEGSVQKDFIDNLSNETEVVSFPGKYVSEAICLENIKGGVINLPGYVEGRFWVQDEAAQLAPHLLAPFSDSAYLDGCAGLGGKTLQISNLIPSGGHVVAVEPTGQRYHLLQDNLQRVRIENVATVQVTLQEYAKSTEKQFQGILIDAPCSGLGVIRRQPDIKWQRTPADLLRYQKTQLKILNTAAPLLQKGGVLVYATCSTEPEENDEVVRLFLEQHLDFVVTSAQSYLPEAARSLVDEHGFFRPMPDDGLDGFFAARLQKKQ